MSRRTIPFEETRLTFPVPRMQFYAIEIARNRNGLNDWIYENNQKEQADAKAKAGETES